MRNIDIFHSLHEPHTSRIVEGFDSVNSGSCSIGTIKGQYRQLNAIVTECATDADQWRIVNLKGQINQVPAFDSVAVLGAVDDDQASALAQLQFGRMFDAIEDDVIETNVHGLLRYLATPHFHKHTQLIRRHHLTALQDVPCAVVPGWDGIELTTHEGKTANLLLDMQRHDDQSGLLSSFDGLAQLLESIGAEYADFDSIIVEYQYLDKLMNMLHKAMQTASKGGVKVLKVDQSDKPFRHKKVLNVAVSYDFEDGQTITILFHHPDRDAKRIAPQDTLLSWKILMNNRDVTGVIQPNQGEGIALPVLAGRVVKLINQNSARFKRTQTKKAENAKLLADMEQRITDKQSHKTALSAEIEGLLIRIDGLAKQPITLTGKELGDFPDTAEGKKALRQAAKAEFEKLLGQWVDCPTLGGQVEIRKSGIKKTMSLSGDPKKLKGIAGIAEIIRNSSLIESVKPNNTQLEQNVQAYHYLESTVVLDGESLNYRIVIKEDDKGQFHYDFSILSSIQKDETPSFDGASTTTSSDRGVAENPLNQPVSRVANVDTSMENNQDIVNAFDAAGEKYVLNLFIEGEDDVEDFNASADADLNLYAQSYEKAIKSMNDTVTTATELMQNPDATGNGGMFRTLTNAKVAELMLYEVDNKWERGEFKTEFEDQVQDMEAWSNGTLFEKLEQEHPELVKRLIQAQDEVIKLRNGIGAYLDKGSIDQSDTDDADYLNKVIKGEVDFSNSGEVEAQLEAIGGRLTSEINDLFEQAVTAYSVYQVDQAKLIN